MRVVLRPVLTLPPRHHVTGSGPASLRTGGWWEQTRNSGVAAPTQCLGFPRPGSGRVTGTEPRRQTALAEHERSVLRQGAAGCGRVRQGAAAELRCRRGRRAAEPAALSARGTGAQERPGSGEPGSSRGT